MKKIIAVFAVIAGCSDSVEPGLFGNEGAGGSAAESSSSGSGGGGGDTPDECETREDCPGYLLAECAAWVCLGGLCVADLAPGGTMLDANKPGDCKRLVCDGIGNALYEQIEDPEDDGNQCTKDTCEGFLTVHSPHDESYPCAKGVCDGMGLCVECLYDFQCASGQVCVELICGP